MDTKQLLKEISRKGNLYRSVAVSRAGIDEKKRTVKIAFSSEEPYQRWFGSEILGHKDSEIDMSFIGSGSAPFLDGHDSSKQIGVIEKAWVDQDKKGRAVVRFSKNPAANEVFQDILDGIRKNISVGYEVGSMVLVSEHENEKTYRVDKWTPLEASSVSIPADRTVGVGRENSPSQKVKSVRSSKMKKENDVEKEIYRIREITALGNHKAGDFKRDAEKAVESGMSIEDFRGKLLKKIDAAEEVRSGIDADPNMFSHRKSVEPETSIVDAILAQLPGTRDSYGAGAALENSQELSRRFGKKPQGVFIELGSPQVRTLQTDVGSTGGYLVAENLLASQFIDYLRNASMVHLFGATVINDLVGDVDIPKQTGTATAYYLDEGEEVAASDQTLGQVRMSPTTIAASTSISRRTLIQSSVAAEQFVKADLSALIGVGIDAAAINGSGASSEPRGILNTTGIGSVTLNAANTPTWANIVALETAIADNNALMGNLAYLVNATIYGSMKVTEKASNTAQFLLEGDKTNNYKCGVSGNMPDKYMLFGNWKDLIIGYWSGLDINVDPYTDSKKGQVNVTVMLDYDLALKRPESFAKGYKA